MSLGNNLENMKTLQDGWDGRGSAAPSPKAIQTAQNMSACALGYGGIQLEIHAGGSDVEIEIDAQGQIIAVAWARA